MARPLKLGLDYFPHDTDAWNDDKIEAMRVNFGNDGYAFYFIILERIYSQRSKNSAMVSFVLSRKPVVLNWCRSSDMRRSASRRGPLTDTHFWRRLPVSGSLVNQV